MSFLDSLLYYLFYPSFFIPVIFPGAIFSLIALIAFVWFERKAAARVQMRVGPYYASPKLGGFLQLIADAIKFIFSEIIIPTGVNPKLFALAPLLLLAVSFLPMVVIPLSLIPNEGSILSPYFNLFYDPNIDMGVFTAFFIEYNLLLVLALAAAYPIFVILLAWVTNNRFAIVGAVRELYLTITYDVLLILSVIAIAIEYHTLDMAKIVQIGIPGVIANPLAAVVFLIASLIATGRFPFEIVEAESELVVGPSTEYSGVLFLFSIGGPYVMSLIDSIIFVNLFLGGWLPFSGMLGALWTVFKAMLVVFFMVFLRSVYGRYRIDQALRGSWKYLFPLSIASIILGVVGGGIWLK
jgi:NADH-quinone oxidoreductase subunit H